MKVGLRVSCLGLSALMLMAVPAAAKVCKDEVISATSREYVSRSLGAFPGSWAAWRKKVKDEIGNGWQAWRRSEDRTIKCDQVAGRWTCTRRARPCKPGSVDDSGTVGGGTVVDTYTPISVVLSRGMYVPPRDRAAVKEQIKTLQYLLNEAGYELKIDGDFGRATQKAITAFQRKNGLVADGKAGPKTIEALTS